MSPRRSEPIRTKGHGRAPILFAALGDETRFALVTKLCDGELRSISDLTHGSRLTRQAVTKHLRVLEKAGLLRCSRRGRESLYALDPEPVRELEEYLSSVSREWDKALGRLKAFVEK